MSVEVLRKDVPGFHLKVKDLEAGKAYVDSENDLLFTVKRRGEMWVHYPSASKLEIPILIEAVELGETTFREVDATIVVSETNVSKG